MIKADFDTLKTSLEDILKDARSGRLQLPDFQRGWVWDDAGIRSLLASISQGFPVGAIMTLQTGGDVRFKPRPIEGVENAVDPENLLLDGQQRLTSIYQSCIRNQVIETRNAQNRAISRWYYLDMVRALEDINREEAIIGVPENKIVKDPRSKEIKLDLSSPEGEYASLHFPMNAIFDSDDWNMGFMDRWNHDPDKSRFWLKFQREIIQAFRKYHMPVISLKKETPKEAVCLVFEKVNTGGKKLDAFELLTAIYAADDFNLRDDWYGIKGDDSNLGRKNMLGKFDVLKNVASTDFLQVISLLHTLKIRQKERTEGKEGKQLSQVSGNRQAILNLPLTAYREWADAAREGFIRAAKFLTLQKIFWFKDIPYQTQVVPLAAILALLGDKWENDSVRQQLARWYWCGVLGELYGSAVESRFALDVQDVPTWIDGGSEPRTITDANFAPDRLDTLRTRQSAAYKGVNAVLMRQGGKDFKSGQPVEYTTYWDESIDIHHIFPQAWCQKIGKIEKERYDSIINKTPTASRTNRIIGGNAPSSYLEKLKGEYEIDTARMDEILTSHLIVPEHLRTDDFESFMAKRREDLLTLIEETMGKPIARNMEPDEDVGDLIEDEEMIV